MTPPAAAGGGGGARFSAMASLAANRRVFLFFAATVFLGPSIVTTITTTTIAGGGGGGSSSAASRIFAMAATGPTVTTGAEPVTVPRVTHHDIDLTPNDDDDGDGDADDDDDSSLIFEDARINGGSDSFNWETYPDLEADSLVEGCARPAVMTGVKVKKDAPASGNVAALAIDGDPSTKWAMKGANRWMDVEFDGGEGGNLLVGGVAIAFYRGDRRVAFFDVSVD